MYTNTNYIGRYTDLNLQSYISTNILEFRNDYDYFISVRNGSNQNTLDFKGVYYSSNSVQILVVFIFQSYKMLVLIKNLERSKLDIQFQL